MECGGNLNANYFQFTRASFRLICARDGNKSEKKERIYTERRKKLNLKTVWKPFNYVFRAFLMITNARLLFFLWWINYHPADKTACKACIERVRENNWRLSAVLACACWPMLTRLTTLHVCFHRREAAASQFDSLARLWRSVKAQISLQDIVLEITKKANFSLEREMFDIVGALNKHTRERDMCLSKIVLGNISARW